MSKLVFFVFAVLVCSCNAHTNATLLLRDISDLLPDRVPKFVYNSARSFLRGFVTGYDRHFEHPTEDCMDSDFMSLFDDYYYYGVKSTVGSYTPLQRTNELPYDLFSFLRMNNAGLEVMAILVLAELLNDCEAVNLIDDIVMYYSKH